MKYVVLISLIVNVALAQQRAVPECNTIFMCVDQETYKNICVNPFIKDTLFICQEVSTDTNKESYQGKYFIGKSATIEWFAPKENGSFGDVLGDIGIEFKTRQFGEQQEIIREANKKNISLRADQVKFSDSIPWYSSIQLKDSPKNLQVSTLEYRKEYLEYLGFTADEIKQSMTFEDFNTKLSDGRAYPRAFSKLKAIKIKINSKTLHYLQDFCSLNGMLSKKNAFTNNDFTIFYTLDDSLSTVEMMNLKVELTHKFKKRTIVLSPKLVLKIHKKEGLFVFN
jgi:hypothetical protein